MSAEFDLVIRNAQVATASDTFTSDIGVVGGRIVQMGVRLSTGAREIDARGRTTTPGGIDAHCHLDQPIAPPAKMTDDFETGTRSAACGGTTTVIPFAAQQKGGSLRAAIDDYHERANGRASIDYGFHLIVTDPTPEIMATELPALIAEGYSSFKIYMTYDDMKLNDGQILRLLALARTHGAMAMIHAENTECIAWLTESLLESGLSAPRYHVASRPMLVEREATHRAISLAELVDVSMLLVHVSGREAVEQIQWARARGLKILSETCPQYLLLTAEDLGIDDGYEGAKCVCSPPPRDAASQQAIWAALADGTFTVFSSDHAPFSFDDDQGKKPGGREVAFPYIPNGIPGIETRLPLLYSEGVLTGRISANRFVELTATNPAKTYGLHPRKGTIAIGSDADLVIWDERSVLLTNAMLHHAVDYTPYEGRTVGAWPAYTISRGEVVWDGERFLGTPGRGRFLQRGLPTMIARRPPPSGAAR
ncbi:dihydropyrimidinase [Caballeronia sp. DA-9]|uniref:dihydropyrimidinase n=1 Tax=Caballeronia sp. DA-9 TaxID=3436237 RepID=UPI003F66C2FC